MRFLKLPGSIAGRLGIVVFVILLGFITLAVFGAQVFTKIDNAHLAIDQLHKQEVTQQHFRHAIHTSIIQVDRVIYGNDKNAIAKLLVANENILTQFARYQTSAEKYGMKNDIYLATEYEPVVYKLRNDFYKVIAFYREGNITAAVEARNNILKVRLDIIDSFNENSGRLHRVDAEEQNVKVRLLRERLYYYSIAIFMVIMVTVILVSVFIFRSIVIPVSLLIRAMDNYDPTKPETKMPLPVDRSGGDELGRLGNSFYEMTHFINVNVRARESIMNQIEQKNSELERFTYTVSHDLKSPLVTVKGFLGLLKKDIQGGDEGRVETDIAQIIAAADQMGNLLDDLLELSRIGRVVNKPEKIGLDKLCQDVVFLLQGPIAQSGAEIQIANEMPAVFADRKRIFEVLQNLIENAIKFSGCNKPEISISAKRVENEVVCCVSDQGIGIDPRFKDKVFDLFDRLDSGVDGTGIGLSLVKRIIEVNLGKVWIESKGTGQGTQVYFTLPTNEEESPI